MTTTVDPRAAVDALAASRAPYLLGVRHHSPALAAVVPALLDEARAEVVCVELPADFQPWLEHLADPETVAPVALAGAGGGGRLSFYPFADFSPELAAVRWARERGVEVVCCDLPLGDPGWSAEDPGPMREPDVSDDVRRDVETSGGTSGASGAADSPGPGTDPGLVAGPGDGSPQRRGSYADGLVAAGTGRDGDDLWDRAVEVLAPGCAPDAVRRAALGVGWALRTDAVVPATDLAREERMRQVVATAAAGGRRVAAVIGAFHAPALLAPTEETGAPCEQVSAAVTAETGPAPAHGTTGPAAGTTGVGSPATHDDSAVTSLVPYSFDLLDSRSGYPAGIRDPLWQQAVLGAAGDPERILKAAADAVTALCREMRRAGHTAGTGEAAETLRLACDLATLRGLPAPGRGELLEAVTTVLGQGEPLGRGRALARALEAVFIGTARGRISPHAPRSGLGPSVEAELAELRLPRPDDPDRRDLRLDPLRSPLDGRREVLLQRLLVIGASYGEPLTVASTGDGTALGTKWRLTWTPSVPARLDLAGVRGVTAAQAAAGTLAATARREVAEGGPTPDQILTGLVAAARCDLPELVDARLHEASSVLSDSADLPELLQALDLLEGLRRGHYPGTTQDARATACALTEELLEAAVRSLPGLAGSDSADDAGALVALADRTAARHLGLRLDRALTGLATDGSPLIQGAALAVRVLLDLDDATGLGHRTAGWIDGATTPEARRALSKRLVGLLTAAGPLLQSSPDALAPLMDRVDALADTEFLDRLPALRGGFDTLAPAARDRLLTTVTERLGERLDLSLDAPSELLALWAAADAAGSAALKALGLSGTDEADGPRPGTPAHGTVPGSTDEVLTTGPADEGPVTGSTDDATTAAPAPASYTAPSGHGDRRLGPTDRWRLLLGRHKERLTGEARRYAHALDELYGRGRGEGAQDLDGGAPGQGGGQDPSFPTAREWSQELEALFGSDVREEVLAGAAEAGRVDVLAQLDPEAVRPSVELLGSVLSLAGGMPESQLARLRPLVKRLVDELARELATRLRPALSGLSTPRPTRRPGGRLDLARTLRANLAHTRRTQDGRVVVVPERPVFSTRASKEADWRLVLVVDVSGSMEASVIWSALTAAVLGGVPTLSTHFLAFSTQVIDLTDRVEDPLSLLLEVRVGGGTHIAAGLAHARSLITVPSRTLVVVVSDFEEGAPLAGLLGEVRALASSGAHLLGCAALDDTGTPRYSVPVARQLVAAGMPVAALSPLALARWVGDRLRGEPR
ncbi:vWA domain-containing protein [Streptomyces sp. E-08]|uniref:vWA domain-containing protein n=1 Tax=Streptomyces sp. E-08 TaxID=3404047 RepID=UPI003CF61FCF